MQAIVDGQPVQMVVQSGEARIASNSGDANVFSIDGGAVSTMMLLPDTPCVLATVALLLEFDGQSVADAGAVQVEVADMSFVPAACTDGSPVHVRSCSVSYSRITGQYRQLFVRSPCPSIWGARIQN